MGQYLNTFGGPAKEFDQTFVREWSSPYSNELGATTYLNGKLYQFWKYYKNAAPITYAQYNAWYVMGVPAQGSYIASDKISDSARNLLCGISQNATQPTTGNAVWLLLSGQGSVIVDATQNLVLGDLIEPSSTDGQVTGVTAGTFPSYVPIGKCTAAVTKSGAGAVFLAICPLA